MLCQNFIYFTQFFTFLEEMLSLTDELAAMSELETALNTLNEKIDEKSKEKTTFRPTKNSHALRASLIREFTRSHLVGRAGITETACLNNR
jgi:hypothetical protein